MRALSLIAVLTASLLNSRFLDAANVVIVPVLTKSQLLSASRFAEILAADGHNVTIVIPTNDLVDIKPQPFFDLLTYRTEISREEEQAMRKQALDFAPKKILWDMIKGRSSTSFPDILGGRCRGILMDEAFRVKLEALKPDVAIVHIFMGCANAHFDRIGVPFLDFCSVPMFPFMCGSAHRIPANPSYVPDLFFSDDEMDFLHRVANSLLGAFATNAFPRFLLGVANDVVAEYQTRHGMPGEDINTLRSKASFLLVHGDLTFESIRPSMPKVVYLGGVQCDIPKPLDNDLKDFVDGSGENGIIVFSLGGALDTDALPHGFIESFFDIFRHLPQRVIWKLKNVPPHLMDKQPPNLKLVNWLPQQDLLGHPKTKLFISHGGIQGSFESICHGKALLGIAVGADQRGNLRVLSNKGMALMVDDLKTMDPLVVKQYISELLHDPKYSKAALKAQALFRDHPQTPAQRLQHAVGYTVRHDGAYHLSSKAAMQLHWFQYYLLDVALFIGLVTSIILCLVGFCLRKCWRCCCSVKKAKAE